MKRFLTYQVPAIARRIQVLSLVQNSIIAVIYGVNYVFYTESFQLSIKPGVSHRNR